MKTWAGRSKFKYDGSVDTGTRIFFGKNSYSVSVSKNQYDRLRQRFLNQTVDIGTSRDNPPQGSLGTWLQKNVTKTAIASYVGPILIEEGYAEKIGKHEIRVVR